MAAPTSLDGKVSTSEPEKDQLRGRYVPNNMTKGGPRGFQEYGGGDPLQLDQFKIDIDAYDTSMDIASAPQVATTVVGIPVSSASGTDGITLYLELLIIILGVVFYLVRLKSRQRRQQVQSSDNADNKF